MAIRKATALAKSRMVALFAVLLALFHVSAAAAPPATYVCTRMAGVLGIAAASEKARSEKVIHPQTKRKNAKTKASPAEVLDLATAPGWAYAVLVLGTFPPMLSSPLP